MSGRWLFACCWWIFQDESLIFGRSPVEGALLAACGGAIGLFLSAIGLRVFSSAIPDGELPLPWMDSS